MLFNSISFLFLFLPTLVLTLIQRQIRLEKKKILVFFSLFFYLMVGIENFLVLILDVFWVYFILYQKKRITVLRASIACSAPIFFLIIAKYSNLFFEVNNDFNIVTVGVSFFTFQLIAYCFDRIKPGCEILGLKDLMLFISFFPQLIAGPIVRISKVKIFYKKLNLFKPSFNRLKICFLVFLIGISLKVIFADNLAEIVNKHKIIQSDFGILNFLLICYTYSLQIYLDFFAYSLCAISLGLFFGIRLPNNFRNPYKSINPQDFWRKWHITLSSWFRDYIYIPLGGNKNILLSLFVVFIICGLWHGVGLSFICWGIYHFLVIIIFLLVRKWNLNLNKNIKIFITFNLISFGWIFFIFPFDEILKLYDSIQPYKYYFNIQKIDLVILLSSVFLILNAEVQKITRKLLKFKQTYLGLIIGIWFYFVLIFLNSSNDFIYFKF